MTASGPITSWQTDAETHGNSDRLCSGAPQSLQKVAAAMKWRRLPLGRTALTNRDTVLKRRDITLPTKVIIVKALVFPVLVYGCESWTEKKSWMLKNWCFVIVVLEKTPESPLDYKEIKTINPKGNQLWIFIGRTVAEAEAPILW